MKKFFSVRRKMDKTITEEPPEEVTSPAASDNIDHSSVTRADVVNREEAEEAEDAEMGNRSGGQKSRSKDKAGDNGGVTQRDGGAEVLGSKSNSKLNNVATPGGEQHFIRSSPGGVTTAGGAIPYKFGELDTSTGSQLNEEKKIEVVLYRSYRSLNKFGGKYGVQKPPSPDVKYYRRSTQSLSKVSSTMPRSTSMACHREMIIKANTAPRGVSRSKSAADGELYHPNEPKTLTISKSKLGTNSKLLYTSTGNTLKPVKGSDFPTTAENKNRRALFENRYVRCLRDLYAALDPDLQLRSLTIAIRVPTPSTPHPTEISLHEYLTTGDGASDSSAMDLTDSTRYRLCVHKALLVGLRRIRSRYNTTTAATTAAALDVLTSVASEVAGELSRVYEYQICMLRERAAVELLAEHAARCGLAATVQATPTPRPLRRNRLCHAAALAKPEEVNASPRCSVILGDNEYKWDLYAVLKLAGLRRDALLKGACPLDAADNEVEGPYRGKAAWWTYYTGGEGKDAARYGFRSAFVDYDDLEERYAVNRDLDDEYSLDDGEEGACQLGPEHRIHQRYRPYCRLVGDQVMREYLLTTSAVELDGPATLSEFLRRPADSRYGRGGEIRPVYRPLGVVPSAMQGLKLTDVDMTRVRYRRAMVGATSFDSVTAATATSLDSVVRRASPDGGSFDDGETSRRGGAEGGVDGASSSPFSDSGRMSNDSGTGESVAGSRDRVDCSAPNHRYKHNANSTATGNQPRRSCLKKLPTVAGADGSVLTNGGRGLNGAVTAAVPNTTTTTNTASTRNKLKDMGTCTSSKGHRQDNRKPPPPPPRSQEKRSKRGRLSHKKSPSASLLRRISRRWKLRRSSTSGRHSPGASSFRHDVIIGNNGGGGGDNGLLDNRRPSLTTSTLTSGKEPAISAIVVSGNGAVLHVPVCQRQNRRRKSLNQSPRRGGEDKEEMSNNRVSCRSYGQGYMSDSFYLNERTVSTPYLYGEYEVKSNEQRENKDSQPELFGLNAYETDYRESTRSCGVGISRHTRYGGSAHAFRRGGAAESWGGGGATSSSSPRPPTRYDTVSCAETRCTRMRRTISQRSELPNNYETYILGDGLLHKRSYSQQKLDQLRKSQVFHIMQGIVMDDLTSNIPALHHGLHRLSEHDLHSIPDGAGEGRAKVDVKPECDRVVADITSKARRRPVVCSSTTDWHDAELLAVQACHSIIQKKHLIPIYVDAIGVQTSTALRNRMLRVLGLRYRVTDISFDSCLFSWINSHRQSLLFVIVNLAINDAGTRSFLTQLNDKIENSSLLIASPCHFSCDFSSTSTCVRPTDSLAALRLRLPDLHPEGQASLASRCKGDPRLEEFTLRCFRVPDADVGDLYEALTLPQGQGDLVTDCLRYFGVTKTLQMLSLFAGLFSVTEATTLCKAYGDASFDSVTMTTLITLNVVEEVPYHIDDRCRPSQYRVNTFIRSKITCDLPTAPHHNCIIDSVLNTCRRYYSEHWLDAVETYWRISDDFERLLSADAAVSLTRADEFSTEDCAQFLLDVLSRERYELLGEQFCSQPKRLCWTAHSAAATKSYYDKNKRTFQPLSGAVRQKLLNDLDTDCIKLNTADMAVKAWALGIQAQLVLSTVEKRKSLNEQSHATRDRFEYALTKLERSVSTHTGCIGNTAIRTLLAREQYAVALAHASHNQRARHLFNVVDISSAKTIGNEHPLLAQGYELRCRLWTVEKLYGRSVECANRAVTIVKNRLGDHPKTQEMLSLKVDCILERGQLATTLSSATESLRLARSFCYHTPTLPQRSHQVATACQRLAVALLRSGQWLDAIGYAQEALEISTRTNDEHLMHSSEMTYEEAVKREREEAIGYVQMESKCAALVTSTKVESTIRNHNTDWT